MGLGPSCSWVGAGPSAGSVGAAAAAAAWLPSAGSDRGRGKGSLDTSAAAAGLTVVAGRGWQSAGAASAVSWRAAIRGDPPWAASACMLVGACSRPVQAPVSGTQPCAVSGKQPAPANHPPIPSPHACSASREQRSTHPQLGPQLGCCLSRRVRLLQRHRKFEIHRLAVQQPALERGQRCQGALLAGELGKAEAPAGACRGSAAHAQGLVGRWVLSVKSWQASRHPPFLPMATVQ